MAINKFQPHVLVLPEDDANRQLATGFVLEVTNPRRIQVLPEAGGWRNVCTLFISEHLAGMRAYPDRHVILLLDFDDQTDRRAKIMLKIPEDLKSRVFVLGVKSEPEALKSAGLGSFESVGTTLAKECRDRHREIWLDDLLNENVPEIDRLEQAVRTFLF
jgi:hypothetical protein